MVARNYIFGKKYGNDLLANLVGYYPLNANGNDFSGNGYNGTLVNSPTFVSGKVNNAINFGNDTVIRYVDIPDNNDFSFTDGVNDLPFTVSFWVYRLATGTGFLVSKNILNNTGVSEWASLFLTERIRFAIYDKTVNASFIGKDTNSTFSIGVWQHVVLSYSGNQIHSGLKIYSNGILQATTDLTSGTYTGMGNFTAPVYLGHRFNDTNGNNKLKGYLDEVAIWKNRELTQSEVTELYNKGNAGLPLI